MCARVQLGAASYRLPAELTATEPVGRHSRPAEVSPCPRLIPRSQPGHGQACGAPGTPQPAEASPSPRRPRTLTGGLCGRISVGQETGNCPRDGLRSPLRRQRPLPETAGLPGGQGAPSYPRDATGQQPWEAAAPARHLREDTPRARWSLRLLGRRWGRPTLGPESLPGSWWVCGFLRAQGRPAHHPLLSRVLTRCAHPGTGAEGAPNAHTRQVCATPQLGTLGLPGLFPQRRARPVHRGRRPRTTQRCGGRTRGAGDSWRSREAGLPPARTVARECGAERSRRKPGGHPHSSSIPAGSGTRGHPCVQGPEDLCCIPFYC